MSLTIQPNCTDNPEFGTIPVNTALDMILEAIHTSSNLETIPVQDCYGRVLAEDIHSTIMVPPFTNSAMDGYAIHHQGIPAAEQLSKLTIIGTTVAGQAFQGKVNQGETVRIMTGAVMPEGTDSVIIQEHVETKNDTITIDSRHQSGQNVRQAGEDIKPGDCVLNKGRQCLPADAGIIASLGIPEIKVFRPLRVAVFSTGSEVCDFSQKRLTAHKRQQFSIAIVIVCARHLNPIRLILWTWESSLIILNTLKLLFLKLLKMQS